MKAQGRRINQSFLRLLSVLSLLGAALAVSGCTGLTLAIANTPATFGDYQVTRDVSYAGEAAQRLDVYRPAQIDASAAAPVVVFLHGGSWSAGTKNQYKFIADALTSRGYVTVVPAYRLYPSVRFPAFVDDAARALAWAHAHAAEFGGDPSRLFVMGHSAGAHIAALLAFDERYLRSVGADPTWLQGFIGLSGPYDFLPLEDATLREIFAPEDKHVESQPVNFVDGSEPPALLLHGLDDQMVGPRNSERLAAKIRDRHGQVEEHYYEGMSHGGILAALSVYYRGRRTVLDEIAKFVERQQGAQRNAQRPVTARGVGGY